MNKEKALVSAYLPSDLIDALDKARGRISRSTYILMLVEKDVTQPRRGNTI